MLEDKTILLNDNNLYSNGTVITFSDGTTVLLRKFIEYERVETDKYYTVKNGDELDLIAWQHYEQEVEPRDAPKAWWIIAEANKDLIINPLDISDIVGKEIVIPDILRFKLINS